LAQVQNFITWNQKTLKRTRIARGMPTATLMQQIHTNFLSLIRENSLNPRGRRPICVLL